MLPEFSRSIVELVERARNPASQPLPALLGSPFELGITHEWIVAHSSRTAIE